MSHFVVNYCELRACQHWRLTNKCVKNGMDIVNSIKYLANMHDSSVCKVREQIDKHRLEQMLEA
jgi:hypothetical protein